ncbi:MAG: hypothetical protein IKC57_02035, partial [Alistipes sp.]|nr:hypothetical protein [Alistipes sp.]
AEGVGLLTTNWLQPLMEREKLRLRPLFVAARRDHSNYPQTTLKLPSLPESRKKQGMAILKPSPICQEVE